MVEEFDPRELSILVLLKEVSAELKEKCKNKRILFMPADTNGIFEILPDEGDARLLTEEEVKELIGQDPTFDAVLRDAIVFHEMQREKERRFMKEMRRKGAGDELP